MYIFMLLLGMVLGALLDHFWDRVMGSLSELGEHLPDTSTFGELYLPGILRFIRKFGIFLLLFLVLVGLLIYGLWPKTPPNPSTAVGGTVTVVDNCGESHIIRVTEEDRARGNVVIGDGNCQLVIPLKLK